MSRALLRQSQSRGNAAVAKSTANISNLSKSSSPHNDDNLDAEAPPDFVRLGIQRMLEQAQQHNNSSNSNVNYNGNSTSMEENNKALQALELVQVRTTLLIV
jgi:hypothetical protein